MDRKQNAQKLANNYNWYSQIKQQMQQTNFDKLLRNGIGTITLNAVKRMKKKI
jgi:hypothetical protein